MPDVDFIFDFASPNAYLVSRALPKITQRTGVGFNTVPCLLGGIFKATNNQAPMVAFANIQNKSAYDLLEFRRFVAKHKLTDFRMNPNFPVNTLMLMRGAIVARDEGWLEDYVTAGLHHMWEAEKKMDDPEVFVAALDESGFDGSALLEKTRDPTVKAGLLENTQKAVERGAFGIPTFFVGDEMFFGKERLAQVEEEIVRQTKAGA